MEQLDDVLGAPDRDSLLDWLRTRPLFHHDADLGVEMGGEAELGRHARPGEVVALAREIMGPEIERGSN